MNCYALCGKPATHYCKTCTEAFCEECGKVHQELFKAPVGMEMIEKIPIPEEENAP